MNIIANSSQNGYIAMIGFADPVTEARYPNNQTLAYTVGEEIVNQGYGLAVGNFTGTFCYALAGARHHRGATLAVIEADLWNSRYKRTDILILTSNNSEKHARLANMCCGGIIIGGGNRSLHLAEQLLMARKPVVAISGSGGIVDGELPSGMICVDGAVEAVLGISAGKLPCAL